MYIYVYIYIYIYIDIYAYIYIYIYIYAYIYIYNRSQRPCILLHCLYIYRKEMNLPSQSITEACYATTLFIYIYREGR